MKGTVLVLFCVSVCLPALAGCGSSPTPPLTLSCKTRRMPNGLVRAAVTVTNTTSTGRKAVIFGPALDWLRYVHPALLPAVEVVTLKPTSRSFTALVVPHVRANKSVHLVLHFAPPRRTSHATVGVAPTTHMSVTSWKDIDNADCSIQ